MLRRPAPRSRAPAGWPRSRPAPAARGGAGFARAGSRQPSRIERSASGVLPPVVCRHSAAAVSSAGSISCRFRSRAASPVAAVAHEPTRRAGRVRSGLRARAPWPRRSSQADPAAAPGRPEGAAAGSPAVRCSFSAPRPLRASAGPSGRRRRGRKSAVRGRRRRTRPRAVTPPSGDPRPLPRTARRGKARIGRADSAPRPPGW